MADDIVEELRAMACPAGMAWTGDDPSNDHGHTECLLYHRAADEIERLKDEIERLRSVVDALVKRPFRGSSAERRVRMYGSDWEAVHDALDVWQASGGGRFG